MATPATGPSLRRALGCEQLLDLPCGESTIASKEEMPWEEGGGLGLSAELTRAHQCRGGFPPLCCHNSVQTGISRVLQEACQSYSLSSCV